MPAHGASQKNRRHGEPPLSTTIEVVFVQPKPRELPLLALLPPPSGRNGY
jgi:hypothetical protein